MSFLHTVLSLIVTLGILVTVHEFGHFWVARRCGVKVLRFSVGFGKPLFRWRDKHNTEYAIAWIPLGGYVSMLDEREAVVAEHERSLAFNRQSVWKRIAIVAAGPIANFILAVITYWLVFVSGSSALAPVIGAVTPNSLAEQAGLQANYEIVAIEGEPVRSWQEVALALLAKAGDSGEITLQSREWQGYNEVQHFVTLDRWLAGQSTPDPLKSLGITPFSPAFPAVVGQVIEGGAAKAAGLLVDDQILSVDAVAIQDWMQWVAVIQSSAQKTLSVEVQRAGELVTLRLTPNSKNLSDGRAIGYIGAAPQSVSWPEGMIREVQYGMFESIGQAAIKTFDMTLLTLDSIRKMVVGLISVENLSGPITIAKVASDSAKGGLESFLTFLAYISISLGVLNLLPIPVLDGGHLLFYFIEAVTGRPVPEKAQQLGLRIGMMLLGSLMLIAFYNDLMRL
ncbi:regulator of sigma E protease [Oceanospirillum multiglobuliferum]|uniref:Zinc metalloprotease n=1 Tax=Oceanospirillum multiglobuliferum TaxID=64969 RepID=A0A1T4RTQ9_9GAMM|nr:sigma E protease regulator RseP [Oceanospirillum multiglobuliferum]OPX54641.1 RIP metalloprotease RseP [Oceanospirillum multiglobuliferum]SKA19374.1 regulator of sigma E protease [Oceanospirillum multiglobuliferum]